jgi:hypothetical protein
MFRLLFKIFFLTPLAVISAAFVWLAAAFIVLGLVVGMTHKPMPTPTKVAAVAKVPANTLVVEKRSAKKH